MVDVKDTPDSGSATRGAPGATSRFPCFDGLRAIAALTVVGVHTTFMSGFTPRHAFLGHYSSRLDIGVPVFFLISGFLLYRPFAAAHFGGKPKLPWQTYAARRLLRILPAYWIALTVSVYVLHTDHIGHDLGSFLAVYGFAQVYGTQHQWMGLGQAWSLCTEMSFYLMLPLYSWAIGQRPRRAERQLHIELWVLAGLIAISFIWRGTMFSLPNQVTKDTTAWLPANLELFAFGMALAVASVWWQEARPETRPSWLDGRALPAASWGAAAVLYVVVCNIGIPTVPFFTLSVPMDLVRQTLYGLVAFCLLLPAVFGPQRHGFIRRALAWRPIVGLGVVSYGVYLWHQEWITLWFRWTKTHVLGVPQWELFLFTAGAAIATASASYFIAERPTMSLKRYLPTSASPR